LDEGAFDQFVTDFYAARGLDVPSLESEW
jgi:hypothetical protein